MQEKPENKYDAKDGSFSIGENKGDVQNDNKLVTGNYVQNTRNNTNLTINKSNNNGAIVAIVAIAAVTLLAAMIVALFIWRIERSEQRQENRIPPGAVIMQGIRGGYYWCDPVTGERYYIDRTVGAELYRKQRIEKKVQHEVGVETEF